MAFKWSQAESTISVIKSKVFHLVVIELEVLSALELTPHHGVCVLIETEHIYFAFINMQFRSFNAKKFLYRLWAAINILVNGL